ncbi:hypothetical protein SLE2022_405950 [Rubroshorea leprosula]
MIEPRRPIAVARFHDGSPDRPAALGDTAPLVRGESPPRRDREHPPMTSVPPFPPPERRAAPDRPRSSRSHWRARRSPPPPTGRG